MRASLKALIAGTALLAGILFLAVARPAAAAAPCWKVLLNDWYDGRIDKTYPISCYHDALKHLPADVSTYSSAHDDIERALQSAISHSRKAGKKITSNTLVSPPPASTSSKGTTTGPTGSSGPSRSGADIGNNQTTTTTPAGRKPGGGIAGVADPLNSGKADSLPVPLLVLGGLAILLVAAGGAGLLAKRVQSRKTGS